MSNFYAAAFNDSLGVSRYNVSLSLYKEVLGLKAMVAIKVKSSSARSYDRELMKTTMDFCRFRNVTGNFLAKLLYDSFKNYSNYQFECPPTIKDYYLRNFEIPINIIPTSLSSIILQGETFFNLTVIVKTRVAKVKGLVQFYTANFYGSFVFK
jgi:Protein of unknown function (DUF1091)